MCVCVWGGGGNKLDDLTNLLMNSSKVIELIRDVNHFTGKDTSNVTANEIRDAPVLYLYSLVANGFMRIKWLVFYGPPSFLSTHD